MDGTQFSLRPADRGAQLRQALWRDGTILEGSIERGLAINYFLPTQIASAFIASKSCCTARRCSAVRPRRSASSRTCMGPGYRSIPPPAPDPCPVRREGRQSAGQTAPLRSGVHTGVGRRARAGDAAPGPAPANRAMTAATKIFIVLSRGHQVDCIMTPEQLRRNRQRTASTAWKSRARSAISAL